MIIRCFTCGKVVANKPRPQAEYAEGDGLDLLIYAPLEK